MLQLSSHIQGPPASPLSSYPPLPPSPRPAARELFDGELDTDSDWVGFTDDALSEGDMTDGFAPNQLVLPPPDIRNLEEILSTMQNVATTAPGRDAIAKFVISEDYVRKLIPLVEKAEEEKSLKDLHCLCSIMKLVILLNDSQIIDHIVNENVVMGVVGALECESSPDEQVDWVLT